MGKWGDPQLEFGANSHSITEIFQYVSTHLQANTHTHTLTHSQWVISCFKTSIAWHWISFILINHTLFKVTEKSKTKGKEINKFQKTFWFWINFYLDNIIRACGKTIQSKYLLHERKMMLQHSPHHSNMNSLHLSHFTTMIANLHLLQINLEIKFCDIFLLKTKCPTRIQLLNLERSHQNEQHSENYTNSKKCAHTYRHENTDECRCRTQY